jgi:hypothetical protein
VASGFILQKRSASPIFGLTERPLLAHSESSLYHGKELAFTFASGKIVSPPSSTSDLYPLKIVYKKILQTQVTLKKSNNKIMYKYILTDTSEE